jgi:ABC-type sugar transport system permease subunit
MRKTSTSVESLILRLIILVIFDVLAVQFGIALGTHISLVLGIGVGIFIFIINAVFLINRLYPWRWIAPALAGMFLLVVYPMGYTVSVAFTNYGDGHLLTKDQVLATFQEEYYAPENSITYTAYIFARPVDNPQPEDFRFWLVDAKGQAHTAAIGAPSLSPVDASDPAFGERDANNIPKALGEFVRVPPQKYSQRLQGLTLNDPPDQIRLTKLQLLSQSFEAQRMQRRYDYDAATNLLTDRVSGKIYHEEKGNFVTDEGEKLTPGFAGNIGLYNIIRVVTDPNVREPFWRVFSWTVEFAVLTVLTQFALGLAFAMILNSRDLPLRAFWRSILIIPYAIPFWITAQAWRGLLNPLYGPVNLFIKNLIGISPQWFTDPNLAKAAILFINMYLGFSYMMLVSLGALQSIPSDLYEAALIDGANDWQQFRFITLPLLLVAVGPLLVASFGFNFNNFTIIELVNNGGPAFSASSVAGHTDILLSYTYRLAFGGRGADYGFAAAICIFIFLIVATLTFINFRFTNVLEEVSENV